MSHSFTQERKNKASVEAKTSQSTNATPSYHPKPHALNENNSLVDKQSTFGNQAKHWPIQKEQENSNERVRPHHDFSKISIQANDGHAGSLPRSPRLSDNFEKESPESSSNNEQQQTHLERSSTDREDTKLQLNLTFKPEEKHHELLTQEASGINHGISPPTCGKDQMTGRTVLPLPSVNANEASPPILGKLRPTATVEALESEADKIANEILVANPKSLAANARLGDLSIDPDLIGGTMLPREVRSFFEPRIGLSLGELRIHPGLDWIRSRGAAALASGSVIAFAPGQFSPSTSSGRRLIAHELVHVLQSILARRRNLHIPKVLMSSETLILIEINLASRKIIFFVQSGNKTEKIVATLDKDAAIPAGHFKVVSKDKARLKTKELVPFKGYKFEKPSDYARFVNLELKTKEVPLNVHSSIIGSDQGGVGSGKQGTGVGGGSKSTSDPGKQGTGKDKTKGPKAAGAGTTEAEKARQFLKKISSKKMPGVTIDMQRLDELLATLNASEIEELMKFIKESAGGGGEELDLISAIELFVQLTPEQREIERANVSLMSEGSLVTSPEEVTVAIKQDAESTRDVLMQGEQLDNNTLARIHSQKKKGLEPINLSKLKFFKEMMLLEGLLAGAASRSPEVGEIAKNLTSAIGGIKGYILEEIAWLAAELAVEAVWSYLAAPVTAGATAIRGAVVVGLIIRRLNKLRQIIARIEGLYNIIQQIRDTYTKINRYSQVYERFRREYENRKAKVEEIKEKLDIDQTSEDLAEDLEDVEELLADTIVEAIEDDEIFGDLLGKFYLPPNPSEEDIVKILMDIPKGVEALKEIKDYYPNVDSSDVQSVTILSLKGVRAGSYLYPFVGFLADKVERELSSVVQDTPDLASRLMGLIPNRGKGRGIDKQKNKATVKAKQSEWKDKRKKERKKRKQESEERKKSRKDEDKKAKSKKEREKQEDIDWRGLKVEILQLESKYGLEGTTDGVLEKEVDRIRGRHPNVSVRRSIRPTSNPGRWNVVVHRKGKRGKVEAKVFMTVAMRHRKVVEKMRRKLDTLSEDKRTRKEFARIAEKFKKPYGISDIDVEEPKQDGDKFLIYATFAPGKRLVVGRVDAMSEYHTGSSGDPIPIFWYKDKDMDYPPSIKLTNYNYKGIERTIPMTGTPTKLKHKGRDVVVGVSDDNIVNLGDKLFRHAEPTDKKTRADYIDALEEHGYDLKAQKPVQEADHVIDVSMAGPDTFDNLWPLAWDINQLGFNRFLPTGDDRPGGWMSKYRIEYLEDGKTVSTSSISQLKGKTFSVMGFSKNPIMPGGKGRNRIPGIRGRKKGKHR